MLRVARDAELEVDDEGGRTQLEVVERELKRRRSSDVVRLEIEQAASPELLTLLQDQFDIGAQETYRVDGPLDLRVLMGLTDVAGFEELRDPPFHPVDVIATEQQADMFALIDDHDVLLHHPYDAYDPVLALVSQAADDPDVLAIKQTLYRTNLSSALIASLQRAAERQKQVTVLVELTARFDEERNIRWARALEEAGAHVIYGIRGYKTHAKICLIVRRRPDGIRRYLHLGTGNYNEQSARVYTDFGLMTSSQLFVEDATALFTALTGYSDPPRLRRLIMAPTGLRARLLKLIGRERRRAEAGQPAEIVAKMNSLVDVEIINALYAASRAGVRIRLNVRGICTLTPGLPGLSEQIEVVSIVDRFLEHSRIFYFLNGGDEEVYLSSADWMTRNLDRRIELMFPVESVENRARVLQVPPHDVPRHREGAVAAAGRHLRAARAVGRRASISRPAASAGGGAAARGRRPRARRHRVQARSLAALVLIRDLARRRGSPERSAPRTRRPRASAHPRSPSATARRWCRWPDCCRTFQRA